MDDSTAARDKAFEDARQRWEQATGRADDADVGGGADSGVGAQHTAAYDADIDPLDKAAYARAYREGGVRGWLRHAHAAGMAQHQQQLNAKREHAAMGGGHQSTTGGQRIVVALVIAMVVFAFGTLAVDQVQYMRGECVWASWSEYDRDDGYVTKLRCIDVDDPVLQDPDFRDIAKLRGNVPPLEK